MTDRTFSPEAYFAATEKWATSFFRDFAEFAAAENLATGARLTASHYMNNVCPSWSYYDADNNDRVILWIDSHDPAEREGEIPRYLVQTCDVDGNYTDVIRTDDILEALVHVDEQVFAL